MGIDGGIVITADEMHVIVINLFAMVRHIENDGFLLFKPADNLIHDGVVIEQGVIVISKNLTLLGTQFWPVVVIAFPFHFRFRTAGAIIQMLALEVENDKVVVGVFTLQLVEILEQSLVKIAQLGIAGVEHSL